MSDWLKRLTNITLMLERSIVIKQAAFIVSHLSSMDYIPDCGQRYRWNFGCCRSSFIDNGSFWSNTKEIERVAVPVARSLSWVELVHCQTWSSQSARGSTLGSPFFHLVHSYFMLSIGVYAILSDFVRICSCRMGYWVRAKCSRLTWVFVMMRNQNSLNHSVSGKERSSGAFLTFWQ